MNCCPSQCVRRWGFGGSVGDYILQEFNTLYLTRFRSYNIATPSQTNTNKHLLQSPVSCVYYDYCVKQIKERSQLRLYIIDNTLLCLQILAPVAWQRSWYFSFSLWCGSGTRSCSSPKWCDSATIGLQTLQGPRATTPLLWASTVLYNRWEPPKILNFDFNADPDPVYQNNADLDPRPGMKSW